MDNNITLIISVYKDTKALKIILDSIALQTTLPNEVIVTEDGEFEAVSDLIKSVQYGFAIIHLTQKDEGWNKNRALNAAIKKAKNEYLIFIDGDCFLNRKFIESTLQLQEENVILCGRRVNIGPGFSSKLKNSEITVSSFLQNYLSSYFTLKKDGITRFEEGLYINPRSFIYRVYRRYIKNNAHVLGCCWSGYKSDFEKVNGFDEDFNMPTAGEDTDVERRMRHFGIVFKTSKFCATVFHLDHKTNFNNEINQKAINLMKSKSDIFFCKNGLKKIESKSDN